MWVSREPGQRMTVAVLVMVTMVLMIAVQIGGFFYTETQSAALIALRNDTREVRIFQQAQVDKLESVESYLLTRQPSTLGAYFAASSTLAHHEAPALALLGQLTSSPDHGSLARSNAAFDRALREVVGRARSDTVGTVSVPASAHQALDLIRRQVSAYLDRRNAQGDTLADNITFGTRAVFVLQILGGAISLLGLLAAFRASAREARARQRAVDEATAAREEIEHLLAMTDLLQSAEDRDDAKAIFLATIKRVLPDLGGSLYLYSNSRDRLDLIAYWGSGEQPERAFSPSNCWALKSGKIYHNSGEAGSLTCAHHRGDQGVLETPMAARGEIIGLLCFVARTVDDERRLTEARMVIAALADALSLALSAIALKDKLQQQASRDTLTGLYNRRHLEGEIQRLKGGWTDDCQMLSLAMLDLDHFKQLNDQHGHLTGDTVLRAVGQSLMTELADEDVACRFGGEEFALLMPSTDANGALRRAEAIRTRIERLSDVHGLPISASVGVATVPATLLEANELVGLADAALYRAKREGRNRVVAASSQPVTIAA